MLWITASLPPIHHTRGKDFAMSLFAWFRQAPSAQQLIAWAVDVARSCHAGVAQRLSPMMYDMTLPEARGYIRARGAEVVESEVVALARRMGLQPPVVAVVKQRATEEVIRMAMADLLKATRQTQPLRRAA
jgi:hypothetical protein